MLRRKKAVYQFVCIHRNTFACSCLRQISTAKTTIPCESHHKTVDYHFGHTSTKNRFSPLQLQPYKALFELRQLCLSYVSLFFFTKNTLHQAIFCAKRLIRSCFFKDYSSVGSSSRLRSRRLSDKFRDIWKLILGRPQNGHPITPHLFTHLDKLPV